MASLILRALLGRGAAGGKPNHSNKHHERHNDEPPQGSSLRRRSEWWHTKISAARSVRRYIRHGDGSVDDKDLDCLARSTNLFLDGYPKSQDDERISSLLRPYRQRRGPGLPVAVLACLPYLTAKRAVRSLMRLSAELTPARYLRVLLLAARINEGLVRENETRFAGLLLTLLRSDRKDVATFVETMEHLIDEKDPASLMPRYVAVEIMIECGVGARMEKRIQHLVNRARYKTLHDEFSWTGDLFERAPDGLVRYYLDEHFLWWKGLSCWSPDRARIKVWELGIHTLNQPQRERLLPLFQLDGPDKRGEHSSQLNTPGTRFKISPQLSVGNDNLQRLLQMLSAAIPLGGEAVDLFILNCLDHTPGEDTFAQLEKCLASANPDHCARLLAYFRSIEKNQEWGDQVGRLLAVARDDGMIETLELCVIPLGKIGRALQRIVWRGQTDLCQHLDQGLSGRGAGRRIAELGATIKQSKWCLQAFDKDSEFPEMLDSFPSLAKLDAIFAVLERPGREARAIKARLRQLLKRTLGRRDLIQDVQEDSSDSPPTEHIQLEAAFWAASPKRWIQDLAIILSRLGLDYETYLSCLGDIRSSPLHCYLGMVPILSGSSSEGSKGHKKVSRCLEFATYLSDYRDQALLTHKCWLQVFLVVLENSPWVLMEDEAKTSGFDAWTKSTAATAKLVGYMIDGDPEGEDDSLLVPVPRTGTGLSLDTLSWWGCLSQRIEAMRCVLEVQEAGDKNHHWLYFGQNREAIDKLLSLVSRLGSNLPRLPRLVLSRLSANGDNLESMLPCLVGASQITERGQKLCLRILDRFEDASSNSHPQPCGLSEFEAAALVDIWLESPLMDPRSWAFLHDASPDLVKMAASLPLQDDDGRDDEGRGRDFPSLLGRLHEECQSLIDEARGLEYARTMLRTQDPDAAAELERKNNIQEEHIAAIPDDLIDAVEMVGEKEYEICFSLSGLSDTQRLARGIPRKAPFLLVYVRVGTERAFSIDWGTPGEIVSRPPEYHAIEVSPLFAGSCSKTNCLFSFYLSQHVHSTLSSADNGIKETHDAVSRLLAEEKPSSCIICLNQTAAPLWQPSPCSDRCRRTYHLNIPRKILLRTLWEDPLVVDLLLSSIFAAAKDGNAVGLLKGCPVEIHNIQTVINSIPPLDRLVGDPESTLAVINMLPRGTEILNLLVWISESLGGFILSAPERLVIPSMPNSKQFILLNAAPEREVAFSTALRNAGRDSPYAGAFNGGIAAPVQGLPAHGGVPTFNGGVPRLPPRPFGIMGRLGFPPLSGLGDIDSSTPTTPVFHGTSISRLFPILARGLKNVSGTSLAMHGASFGPGVYVGADQATSWGYAGNVGVGWSNSQLKNMRVMLGCEMVNSPSTRSFGPIVVDNSDRLAVSGFIELACPPSPIAWVAQNNAPTKRGTTTMAIDNDDG
ncbi:hypothetical protein MKZ38_006480 [Zalerion maritima]|uniref:Uncharacterized protein n=1 Tax=Zalerion maritima TaxID=339359 RepID=A0AAD5S092_9PEZI|nr:hypothetical protein MKZ38_006480 [Zalerion maritima]